MSKMVRTGLVYALTLYIFLRNPPSEIVRYCLHACFGRPCSLFLFFFGCMQFSPMGHYFASCSHDRTARVWSMDRIQPLRIMAGHLSDVDVSF